MISAPPRESQPLLICHRKEFYAAPVQRAEHHINSCRGTPRLLPRSNQRPGTQRAPGPSAFSRAQPPKAPAGDRAPPRACRLRPGRLARSPGASRVLPQAAGGASSTSAASRAPPEPERGGACRPRGPGLLAEDAAILREHC